MSEVAVIIPIYKSTPDKQDVAAITQCQKILGSYPVVFVCAEDFATDAYLSLIPGASIERFKKHYFENVNGYNKLMLSLEFYQRFSKYEYILIYQTDAWVFRDELKVWCSKGYDYIGAPVHKFRLDNFTPEIEIATLNGGFSIRKTASCIRLLKSFHFIYKFGDILNANQKQAGSIVGFFKAVSFYLRGNNTYHHLNKYDRNEDYFFALIAPAKDSRFKVAPPEESAYFSFDKMPELSFEMTNHKLPFGAHAIEKYMYFWKDKI
jgi:hypothetical protein